ncbi:DUF3106 domain-containing protein [Rubrivivax sp. RP6-9]|uniref:DUF3106 domain-containing protein n=1 Tax=Rubrivivax sp. RP6-9 TaxID=3415750 RepID=UPI003CC54878
MTLRLAAALFALALCTGVALAADGEPPAWSQLTKAQQTVLAPLQRDWSAIDSQQKAKWLEVAGRYPKMHPADRQRLQERMAAWARMTPAERTRARMQFKESRQFSPEDRQARWEAYQALPDDERRKLAQQRAKPAVKASAANGNGTGEPAPKRNIVSPARQTAAKPVTPTVVQARPGATTSVMSTRTPAPAHQQPGLPKIAATEGFVHPDTLLPRRGPQGAAVSAASAPDDRP